MPSQAPPTEEEWKATQAFMQVHSPEKFKLFENVGNTPNEGWKEGLRRGIVGRFRELKRLEAEDPEQYKLEVARVELEDKLFVEERHYRMAKNTQEQSAAREALRAVIVELVDNRQARWQRKLDQAQAQDRVLQEQISFYTSEIAKGEQSRDQKIEEALNNAVRLHRRGGGGRDGGPPPGRGGAGGPDDGAPRGGGERPKRPDEASPRPE